MSRSGYNDDGWDDAKDAARYICWRGAVASAIKGKRGQALLREIAAAMDAMPEKRLIAHELVRADGQVCTLGTVAASRGVNVEALDPENYRAVADAFKISPAFVREVEFMNDEGWYDETPEQRWTRMREWIAENIVPGA